MATLAQLEEGMRRAYEAGNMEYARILGAELVRARQDSANQIPGNEIPGSSPTQEPSLMDKAIGVGETALTMGTGMVGGTIGMIGGAARGLGEALVYDQFGTPEGAQTIQRNAMQGAQALTYAPRTQTGQKMAQATGQALADVVPPVVPMMAPLNAAAAAPGAANAARMATQKAAAPVVRAAESAAAPVKQAMSSVVQSVKGPEVPQGGSINAAQVAVGTLRQEKANELPVPIPLTQGQRTRDFAQQRFERETAKDPDMGAPIRERMAQQQLKMRQNLDAFVDATGA